MDGKDREGQEERLVQLKENKGAGYNDRDDDDQQGLPDKQGGYTPPGKPQAYGQPNVFGGGVGGSLFGASSGAQAGSI